MVKFNVSAYPPSLNFTWNDNQINLQDITTAISTAIYNQTFNCISDTNNTATIKITGCGGLYIDGNIINAGVQSAKNQCSFTVANLTQMKNSIANEIAASLSNKESALGSILSDATNEITQNIITTIDQKVNQQMIANVVNKAVMQQSILLGGTPQCYVAQYSGENITNFIPSNRPNPSQIGTTPKSGLTTNQLMNIYNATTSSVINSANDIPEDTSNVGLIPFNDPNFVKSVCNKDGDPGCNTLQNYYNDLKTYTNSYNPPNSIYVSACSECGKNSGPTVIKGNLVNFSIQNTLNSVCLKDANVSSMANSIATSVNDALSNKITMGFFEIILIIVVLVVVGVIIFRALKKGKSNTYVEGQTPGTTVSLSPS